MPVKVPPQRKQLGKHAAGVWAICNVFAMSCGSMGIDKVVHALQRIILRVDQVQVYWIIREDLRYALLLVPSDMWSKKKWTRKRWKEAWRHTTRNLRNSSGSGSSRTPKEPVVGDMPLKGPWERVPVNTPKGMGS